MQKQEQKQKQEQGAKRVSPSCVPSWYLTGKKRPRPNDSAHPEFELDVTEQVPYTKPTLGPSKAKFTPTTQVNDVGVPPARKKRITSTAIFKSKGLAVQRNPVVCSLEPNSDCLGPIKRIKRIRKRQPPTDFRIEKFHVPENPTRLIQEQPHPTVASIPTPTPTPTRTLSVDDSPTYTELNVPNPPTFTPIKPVMWNKSNLPVPDSVLATNTLVFPTVQTKSGDVSVSPGDEVDVLGVGVGVGVGDGSDESASSAVPEDERNVHLRYPTATKSIPRNHTPSVIVIDSDDPSDDPSSDAEGGIEIVKKTRKAPRKASRRSTHKRTRSKFKILKKRVLKMLKKSRHDMTAKCIRTELNRRHRHQVSRRWIKKCLIALEDEDGGLPTRVRESIKSYNYYDSDEEDDEVSSDMEFIDDTPIVQKRHSGVIWNVDSPNSPNSPNSPKVQSGKRTPSKRKRKKRKKAVFISTSSNGNSTTVFVSRTCNKLEVDVINKYLSTLLSKKTDNVDN